LSHIEGITQRNSAQALDGADAAHVLAQQVRDLTAKLDGFTLASPTSAAGSSTEVQTNVAYADRQVTEG
jgi:hypothetical protein